MKRRAVPLIAALAAALASAGFALCPAAASTPPPGGRALPMFNTEDAAQKYCPNDAVVWLNPATGVYHYKGQHYYRNTPQGVFVCQSQAAAAGFRANRKGR